MFRPRFLLLHFAVLALAIVPAVPAFAGTITTFFASDPGVGPSGPFTNSNAESTTFIAAAAALGYTVHTHGLGNQPNGSLNGLWLNGDGTFVVTGVFSAGQNGITNKSTGSPHDGFNVSNSNKFVAIGPGNSITFNMNHPTTAFGSFFTGLDGSTLHITLNDGVAQTINVPTTLNGGAQYFGFTNTSTFTSFTVADLDGDNFGMDGISFGFPVIVLPTVDDVTGVFHFSVDSVGPDSITFIDPEVAIGYIYDIGAGDPNFASVILPDVGDGIFDLEFLSSHVSLAAGVQFFFPAGGVAQFTVRGIETWAGLDPADTLAFITGLTFISQGSFTGTMTPIVQQIVDVPEPASLLALASALLGFGLMRRVRTG